MTTRNPDFPAFRSAIQVARNPLGAVRRRTRMVIWARCPSQERIRIPANPSGVPSGGSIVPVRLTAAPPGSIPYRGPVDVVVVGCHAFDPTRRRLMALDTCRTQYLLEEWTDGLPDGWRLGGPLVVALASDAQQVSGWPESAEGHAAHLVATPTRLIALGSGETVMLEPER